MLVIFHSSLSSRKYLCSISSCKEVGKGQRRHREDSNLNSSLSPSLCPDTIFSPDLLSHSDFLTSCLHSLPYFHISDSLLKPSQPACNPHYSAKNTLSQVTSIEVTVWRTYLVRLELTSQREAAPLVSILKHHLPLASVKQNSSSFCFSDCALSVPFSSA